MKQAKIIKIILLSIMILSSYSFAEMPDVSLISVNAPPSSTSGKSGLPPMPPPQTESAPPTKKIVTIPVQKVSRDLGIPYTNPGIVGLTQESGGWIGSDHLYNMEPAISVFVEIVKPEDKFFESLKESALNNALANMFKAAGITTPAPHEPSKPSLPLFNVQVMINTIDQYVFASINCRLFEEVTVKRVDLDPGITFQAITWEKEQLLSAKKEEFVTALNQSIMDLTKDFLERFNHFQMLKSRLDK